MSSAGREAGEARMRRFLNKIGGQVALLRADPERFARNLTQYTHPALFAERLVDVQHVVPMHVRVERGLPRMLNVLDAAWTRSGMTGGPNTVVNLACRVAQQGVGVRLVSTTARVSLDPVWFRGHAKSLLGGADFPEIGIASACDASAPLGVGADDMFLATHWTTAQQLKPVLPQMMCQRFFYMLQEFEPAFHAWSSNYARAIETYGMDFWPIVNESVLADFLFEQRLGRLSDPETRARAMVFEPAVDRALFRPQGQSSRSPASRSPASRSPASRPQRLLFYARPSNPRNMFGLGLLALRAAAADPAFAGWEFLAIGSRSSVPELDLGSGHVLKRAPWLDYAGYAGLLSQADILLCPMLSPHTSYPVLEMAACGGLSVTNTFATKTACVLGAMSPSIVAVEPTVEGFTAGLIEAAGRAGVAADATLHMPRNWAESLDPVAARIASVLSGGRAA